jgi:calpain-7
MKAIKLASSRTERERLKSRCMKVLARAEEIKKLETWAVPLEHMNHTGMNQALKAPLSNRTLTTREQIILLESSKLHGFVFSPWISEPEEELFQALGCNEPFLYGSSTLINSVLFVNSHRDSSELKLSKSQQKYFAGWRRPCEAFCDSRGASGMPENNIKPNMIATNNVDLIQDVTADCSVVASLCAAVARPGREFEKVS